MAYTGEEVFMPSTQAHTRHSSLPKALGTFVIAVLLLSALPVLAKAQAVDPTPGAPGVKPLDIGPVPSMALAPSASSVESMIPPQAPDGDPINWTKLVYQSWQTNNWEIYTAKSNGSNQVNLTNNPNSDARPRLNTRALQIAFNSDRSGNQDIYIMNSDGSAVSQVTHSKKDDYAPAWSTDNTRLVFVSERDGNPEIYSIDLSNLVETRLTHNPAIDAFSTWSPDSAHIAWVRYAGTTGTLWIANPDGSSPQAIYSAPYLQHPAWSPDGSRIAFDADLDGDGWNEIGAIHPDGSGIQTLYDIPVPRKDAWMGNWSKDGKWILYTSVEYYIKPNGQLEVTHMYVYRLKFGDYPEIVVNHIFDQLPDWKVMDIDPPTSNILALGIYLRAAHFFVSWQGSDAGISGIDTYDIQARVGAAGSWTDWITNTKTTTALFSGTGGDTLYFRSRAEDNAGNVEAWPGASGGDASTTLFTWLLTGLTQDNRAFAVPNTTLSLSPAALSPLISGKTGGFFGRLTASGAHTLQASQAGYGPVDPAHLNINLDFNYDSVLPPQDNVVVNGGFESSASLLTGWTVTGTLPAAPANAAVHTGNEAASLGVDCPEPCLGDAEHVPGGMSYTFQPSIAVGSDNTVHVVGISFDRYLYYSYRSTGGSWSPAVQIGSGEGNSSNMSMDIAIDGLNNLHVVWNAGAGPINIKYAYKTPSGVWSTPIDIGEGLMPKVAADHHNNVYVLYGDTANFKVRKRTASGVWEPAITLGEGYVWDEGAICIGLNDEVHLVYAGFTGLFYRLLSPTGSLSDVYTISPTDAAVYTVMDVDSQGILWVTWTARLQSGDTGRYSIRTKDGVWSFPEDLPGISDLSDARFDKSDRLHILGNSITNTNDCMYLLFKPEEGWYGPVLLANNGWCTPSVKFDALNRMHALIPTYSSMDYHSTALALAPSQGSIHQAMTIPAGTHQATLSWLYRIERHSLEIPSLTVSISTSYTATQVFSSTAAIGWEHAWADVSPWAGQTVTVTFTLHQAAGEPLAHLYLDEVSLGSWLTPVVAHVSPARLEVWDPTDVITITGLNFIDTPAIQLNGVAVTQLEWVDEHTVRIHLPANLPVGTYDVTVTNPGGQVGILPSGLRLGQFIFLPVTVK